MTGKNHYHIVTFGCQMNESDSERMHGIMDQLGYTETGSIDNSDVILINTCCVRETAENKVYGLLGRLKKIKEKRPELVIGVGGCMTQLESTAAHIKKRYPYVNFVFGTGLMHQLPDLLERATESKKTMIICPTPEGVYEGLPVKRADGLKAWVPVMYGCDNFCTYCIVPHVRGRERSRRPEDILKEVKDLTLSGCKEVTLLGQNVNSYGKDFGNGYGFGDLLDCLNNVEGLLRIRFMTSHPKDFSFGLIDSLERNPKVCEHFHIPLQSGSDHVLKAMNRGYDREYYLGLISGIRKRIPRASITTDIMVGFPGETEEDFAATIDMLERVGYDAAYTFIYNIRSGTPAEKMADQIPGEEKTRRIGALIKRQNQISIEKNTEEAGRIHQVLVEGPSKSDEELMTGRTRTNKLVIFPGRSFKKGDLADVKIIGGTLTYLKGEEPGEKKCPCVGNIAEV
ncbi:MAG: dimethylallyladenosine tRNA methylthiotransferase [Peptococcaceae bacterium BICA1-7]|nr:MAG: dimethylallyladenosine tRNA methylthiotransferase [Peptococcaceae bacterium BICA1-7]HBV96955.1 tRNA (N6-isopentenyl adenosine(37)-C2)-methylthiotransferase MiaB [Desulfotomaculum sp.]